MRLLAVTIALLQFGSISCKVRQENSTLQNVDEPIAQIRATKVQEFINSYYVLEVPRNSKLEYANKIVQCLDGLTAELLTGMCSYAKSKNFQIDDSEAVFDPRSSNLEVSQYLEKQSSILEESVNKRFKDKKDYGHRLCLGTGTNIFLMHNIPVSSSESDPIARKTQKAQERFAFCNDLNRNVVYPNAQGNNGKLIPEKVASQLE